jgi:hypothetical protein
MHTREKISKFSPRFISPETKLDSMKIDVNLLVKPPPAPDESKNFNPSGE